MFSFFEIIGLVSDAHELHFGPGTDKALQDAKEMVCLFVCNPGILSIFLGYCLKNCKPNSSKKKIRKKT